MLRAGSSTAGAPTPYGGTVTASSDFGALSATVSELVPLADTPVEQHELALLRAAIDACALTVRR